MKVRDLGIATVSGAVETRAASGTERVLHVLPGFKTAACFARHYHGQFAMIMGVPVSELTGEVNDRVIEHGGIAFSNGLELSNEVREALDVEQIDLFFLTGRGTMGNLMVAHGYAG